MVKKVLRIALGIALIVLILAFGYNIWFPTYEKIGSHRKLVNNNEVKCIKMYHSENHDPEPYILYDVNDINGILNVLYPIEYREYNNYEKLSNRVVTSYGSKNDISRIELYSDKEGDKFIMEFYAIEGRDTISIDDSTYVLKEGTEDIYSQISETLKDTKAYKMSNEEYPEEGCFVTDYYNKGGSDDYRDNVIFNSDIKKFVKMENGEYKELEQGYREQNIKYDDFDIKIKWYFAKDGDRTLYYQDLEDIKSGDVNYGDYRIHIVTDTYNGEDYLLLCKNTTHAGYSWQYPLKFNAETGEYEDFLKDAKVNGKNVKEYGYLSSWILKKDWENAEDGISVQCYEVFEEPELQVWSREIVEIE